MVTRYTSAEINADTWKLLKFHPLFQEMVRKCREQFQIKGSKISTENQTRVWIGELQSDKQKQWHEAIDEVLKKFGLSSNFFRTVQHYVASGRSMVPAGWTISVGTDEFNGVSINLHGNIKTKELSDILQRAYQIAKDNAIDIPHYSKYTNIDRDIALLASTAARKTTAALEGKSMTDTMIATELFQPAKSDRFRGFDKRKAKLIQKARERFYQRMRERFPDDTFAPQ